MKDNRTKTSILSGEKPLWFTFWVCYIPVGTLFNMFSPSILKVNLFEIDTNIIAFWWLFAFIIYSVVMLRAIWKSAKTYKGIVIWKYLAQIIVIIHSLVIITSVPLLFKLIDTKNQSIPKQEIIQPISQEEYQTALDGLDANIADRQAEIEEWYRLNTVSPDGDLLSKLLPDQNSRFHGLDFGMTIDQVKAHESARSDTILSPVPSLRPGSMISYWYYIADGVIMALNYQFDSSHKLDTIQINNIDTAYSDVEIDKLMPVLVQRFSSVMGEPQIYLNHTYEWSAPTFKCFVFAFPSKLPSLMICYASYDSAHNVDADSLRERLVNSGMFEMNERFIQQNQTATP